MGKKLRFTELAKALGVANASVTMAIKNKMLLPEDNEKKVDIDRVMNRAWIDAQIAKGKDFDLNRIYDKKTEVIKKDPLPTKEKPAEKYVTEEMPTTRTNGHDLYNKKLQAEIDYKEAMIEKTKIDIRKREGELIPFDQALFLLNYVISGIRNKFIQEIDSLANEYKQRFDISQKEFVEVKKDLTGSINVIYKDAVEEMKKGVDGIQDEYREVRGRGERK